MEILRRRGKELDKLLMVSSIIHDKQGRYFLKRKRRKNFVFMDGGSIYRKQCLQGGNLENLITCMLDHSLK